MKTDPAPTVTWRKRSRLSAMQLRMFGRLRRETRRKSALVPMQRREAPRRPAGARLLDESE